MKMKIKKIMTMKILNKKNNKIIMMMNMRKYHYNPQLSKYKMIKK